MNRFSLILGLVFSLMFFGLVSSLDARDPLVVSFARTVRVAEINAQITYAGIKKAVTGKQDYMMLGSLYLAKGWIEGPQVWSKARAAYYKGAVEGDKDAAYAFALLNLTGIGGPKNAPVAVTFFEIAAKAGHRNAHWQLGNYYLSPAHYDVGEATRWLARAFVLGDERAFNLLVMVNPSRTRSA